MLCSFYMGVFSIPLVDRPTLLQEILFKFDVCFLFSVGIITINQTIFSMTITVLSLVLMHKQSVKNSKSLKRMIRFRILEKNFPYYKYLDAMRLSQRLFVFSVIKITNINKLALNRVYTLSIIVNFLSTISILITLIDFRVKALTKVLLFMICSSQIVGTLLLNNLLIHFASSVYLSTHEITKLHMICVQKASNNGILNVFTRLRKLDTLFGMMYSRRKVRFCLSTLGEISNASQLTFMMLYSTMFLQVIPYYYYLNALK